MATRSCTPCCAKCARVFWLALDNWQEIMQVVGLLEIPRLVLGVGLQVIALG